MTATKRIKIAVPKKGRLRKPIVKMLNKARYVFKQDDNLLHAHCVYQPIDFIFLRTDDIPTLIDQKKVDLGFTGRDLVKEGKFDLQELLNIEMGNCELALAGPKEISFDNLSQLKNKKIATSFPHLTKTFFQKKNIPVECITLNGSIEIMLKLNVCDAIVDLVETGNTLKDNNLEKWEVLEKSYAAVFSRKDFKKNEVVEAFLKRLKGIIIASHYSILEYNIKKSSLLKAEKITPGLDAPTIAHLDDPKMVAIKVMIKKSDIIEAMDKLEEIGASGIFEMNINNCRL